jgi:transposase
VGNRADQVIDFVDGRIAGCPAHFAMEAGEASIRLTRNLRAKGCEVSVLEAFQVSKFLKVRQNKTDTNDARGIVGVYQGPDSRHQLVSAQCQNVGI